MLRHWRQAAWIAAFALLVLGFSAEVWRASQQSPPPKGPQHSSQGQSESKQADHKGETHKTLWERTWEDPTAFFTFWIATFTFVLAASTIGLWIATFLTLRHSREYAQRQLRAYVGLEKLGFQLTNENNPDFVLDLDTVGIIHEDFITVKIRNFGPTPARDVIVFVFVAVTPPHHRLPDDFFLANDRDVAPIGRVRITLARFLLHPNQMEITKTVFHPHSVREARARHVTLYVYGRIYYRDIYNRPWRTRFCYVWEPSTGNRSEGFVAYEKYNGEDQIELG